MAASQVGTPLESWDKAVKFGLSKMRSHLARLPEPDLGGGGAGRQGGGGFGAETTGGSAASDCTSRWRLISKYRHEIFLRSDAIFDTCAGEIPLLGGV